MPSNAKDVGCIGDVGVGWEDDDDDYSTEVPLDRSRERDPNVSCRMLRKQVAAIFGAQMASDARAHCANQSLYGVGIGCWDVMMMNDYEQSNSMSIYFGSFESDI